jgi:hypothetical protein
MVKDWVAAWQRATPLARGGLCLVCRTVVGEGEACHGADAVRAWDGGKLVEQLVATGEGEALAEGSAGVSGAELGIGAATVSGMTAAFAATGLPTFALLGLMAVVGTGAGFRAWLKQRRQRKHFAAQELDFAAPASAGVPDLPALRGRIVAGATGSATGSEVAREQIIRPAWSLDGKLNIARLGETAGFLVTLDDGRGIAVVAGRLRIHDEAGLRTSAVAGESTEEDRLARLDQVSLRVGDRVELVAAIEPAPTGPTGYRDAPSFTYVTAPGVTPVVRLPKGR